MNQMSEFQRLRSVRALRINFQIGKIQVPEKTIRAGRKKIHAKIFAGLFCTYYLVGYSHPGSDFCLQPAFSVQWIYLDCLAFFCTEFSGGLSKAIQKCRSLPGQKTSAVGRVLNCSKMLLPRPFF